MDKFILSKIKVIALSFRITLMKFVFLIIPLVLSMPISSFAEVSISNKKDLFSNVLSEPTVSLENEYLKALSSDGGRFCIGTTGGDPNTPNDDDKEILYGYPYDVGSSFTTLRIDNDNFKLGNTANWDSDGLVPTASPNNNGNIITTIWNQSGIWIEEKLYFVHNSATGRSDTTAIEYVIKNESSSTHNIGIRIMLDTMVGNNDGAPYFIDGIGQVTMQSEWNGASIPEYWIAYESSTFEPDSLKSRGQLKNAGTTTPDRFIVADWPQAFVTVWDYTVDQSDLITNDSAVILYYDPIAIGPGQTRTVRTYYGISSASLSQDIQMVALEVTQAVQDLKNSVSLIKDRPTFVRAHVKSSNGTINDLSAELIGTRNGTALAESPLKPANPNSWVDIKENPNRSVLLNDSYLFELPLSWRNGTIGLELVGDGYELTCSEPDGNSDCKIEVSFADGPPLNVRFVGVTYEEGGSDHTPDRNEIREVVEQLESTYPITSLSWDHPYNIKPSFFPGRPSGEISSAVWMTRINAMIAINRTMDGCISGWPVNCRTYYLGVLTNPAGGLLGMSGGTPANVATGYADNDNTLAHELGHATGQNHTNYTGTEGGPGYHEPIDGTISSEKNQWSDETVYGFDIHSKERYMASTADMMSYGSPNWPSPWTYNHIKDNLTNHYGSSAIPEASNEAFAMLPVQADQPAIVISGLINFDQGTGEIISMYNISSPVSVELQDPGNYSIVYKNSQGQIIQTYSFQPNVPPKEIDEENIGWFTLLLPWDENTIEIVLNYSGGQILAEGGELDSTVASNNAPTVSIVYPNGSETLSGSSVMLQWNANDNDNDTLSYILQYSRDGGGTWETIVSDLLATSYELNLEIIGGTNFGLIRVFASDGFHTAQDESDATFKVAGHAPEAFITSPETGTQYIGNATIILSGCATDNEDGEIVDGALNWTSDIDGVLGSSRSLSIDASTMTPGNHTITLTAKDSQNTTGTATIDISIWPTPQVLPTSMSVSPSILTFSAIVDSSQHTESQLIGIRNEGDNVMIWNANASENWIILSSNAGTAPTDILISANPQGLNAGIYTGQITISSLEANNSPQAIEISFTVTPPSFFMGLNSNWNLISIPVMPSDTSIISVLQPIASKFSVVWSYQNGTWKVYDSENPGFSDLDTMVSGLGYWIDMTEQAAFLNEGTVGSQSINLNSGWNLVGFNSLQTMSITNFIGAIANRVLSVWTYVDGEWKLYSPQNLGFNNLSTAEPGFGYWINVTEPCILILP